MSITGSLRESLRALCCNPAWGQHLPLVTLDMPGHAVLVGDAYGGVSSHICLLGGAFQVTALQWGRQVVSSHENEGLCPPHET